MTLFGRKKKPTSADAKQAAQLRRLEKSLGKRYTRRNTGPRPR